jgi:signal peptidase I
MATKAPAATRRDRRIPAWLELVLLLGVALLLSILIKTFLVQMFFVPSESMEPLFIKDDRILVQKVSYWTGDVQRGDVVVFADPGGWLGPQPPLSPLQSLLSTVGLYPAGGHLVKRVIAVGGDEVMCCDAKGRVTVNGVPLNEKSYIKKGTSPSDRSFDVKVPQGRLWVMGDNRSNSEDSRFHQRLRGRGTIPADDVVGKVWAIVWPLGRFHVIRRPATFDQDFEHTSETPPKTSKSGAEVTGTASR